MTINLTEDQKLERTFFHELGHFIAHELNYRFYLIGDGVDNIFITKCERDRWVEYRGGTVPIRPKGYINNGEIENLKEHIAVLLYGCIFQTLYLKTISETYSFGDCFCYDNSCNGKCDADSFCGLEKYIPGYKRDLIKDYTNKKYIDTIFSYTSHLNKLIKITPDRYLINESKNTFAINLDLLRSEFEDFINEHKFYYDEYLQKINEIISSLNIDSLLNAQEIQKEHVLMKTNCFYSKNVNSYEQFLNFNEYIRAFLITWNLSISLQLERENDYYIAFLEQESYYSEIIEAFRKIKAIQIVQNLEKEKHSTNKKEALNRVLKNSDNLNELLYSFVCEHRAYFS